MNYVISFIPIIIGIVISGNEQPHALNSSVDITCSSDLDVQSIRWLDLTNGGQELFSNIGQQQLVLPIVECYVGT